MKNPANFPNQVWAGLSPTRIDILVDRPPDYEDWDQAVSEIIATQEEVVILKSKVNGPVVNIQASALGFFGASPVGQQSKIADITGGLVIDLEVRSAVASIITLLETFGLTASS